MIDIERDREILLNSAREFMATERFRRASILAFFTDEDMSPLTKAIEACSIYRQVANKVVFSSSQDVLLNARDLADKLGNRVHTQQDAEEPIDWLIGLLSTETSNGSLIAAIWGLEIAEPVPIADGIKLVPFSALRPSFMKRRTEERGGKSPGWFTWWSDREWSVPGAAYVAELRSFPFLDAGATRKKVDGLLEEGRRIWTLIEVLGAKSPLVFGSWFEYENEELDLAVYDTFMTLSTPEIPPKIKYQTALEPSAFSALLDSFRALPRDYQNLLLRAADRFCLSKCRWQRVDCVLDLALAYEIAVSGKGDQGLSPTWKVSTRTAQMVGGDLATRLETRATVRSFYQLRNEAAHGGSLSSEKAASAINRASEIFPELLSSLISNGQSPNWASIEIESPSASGGISLKKTPLD